MALRSGITRLQLLAPALLFGVLLVPLLGSTPAELTPAAAAAPTPQRAGVTIAGSVVDGNLVPLPDVTVTLSEQGGASREAKTDTRGRFTFTGVIAGDYQVRAERAGFAALLRAVHVSSGTPTVQLPLVLTRPGEELNTDAMRQPPMGVVGGIAAAPMPSPPASAQLGGGGRGGTAATAGVDSFYGASGERSVAQRSMPSGPRVGGVDPTDGERYAHVAGNRFERTVDRPLSTFGADVDTASFTNVRRFLTSGQLPPPDAVRVEEFVNYFKFDYATPRGSHPIGLTTEVGEAPWAPGHKLVLIGARATAPIDRRSVGRNLVLLIDVSGSMATPDKLPLIKTALNVFVATLNPDDRLAIVTYAGASGVVLPSTPARQRDRILDAINRLGAAGSTNGGQGIVVAYRTARQAFIPGGINRVILATDGDFNVGVVSQRDLLDLIQREKESGIFLSVLGVGTGNLKDSTMEMLADKGNGHYAYLDSLQEARRVLVAEADATLETVAKEVKFQVEFNPAEVAAWKLIGYENRRLAAEDFNDDRKDGGEVGAGHTVTVLYEIVLVGAGGEDEVLRSRVDPLKYQELPAPSARVRPTSARRTDEWMTVKVRYQLPGGDTSRLIEQAIRPTTSSGHEHLPFASAVAEFGLLLRGDHMARGSWDALAGRIATLKVSPSRQADREALAEVVGLARSLARVR
ncbi:MAG: von Willebrand factor type A domain-containing protein [Vicinamibacterales bacterium]